MVPILYDTITEGTVPTSFGLGCLSDALECSVDESRNSVYELTLTYAAQGVHADEIKVDRYIKAQPNFTDSPQLFQIYKVGKVLNGRFEINAKHISYILSDKVIASGTANNVVSACALLTAQAGGFTINTDKNTAGDFEITEPSSVKSWFGGKKGSLLDVYGGGEWYYNNFTATLKANRGVTTPRATIRYGKNLTALSQTIDASNLYTHVLAYFKNDETKVTGNEVATGLSGSKRVLVLDASGEFQDPPTTADLDSFSTSYIGSHNLTTPKNNFTLNFVQSGQLFDRVDLCDVVNVYFEQYDINASVKCIRVKWDVLRGRYIETEFGDPKANITDTISDASATANAASIDASEAQNLAKSKARVFVTTPVPPYDIGDIWTDSNDIYYCTTPRTETVTGSGSGSIVEFETLIGGALTSCEVEIEGTQSGTGTPSPSNPRPLVSYTEANISRTGKNLVFKTLSDANIGGTGTIASAVGFSDLQVARVVEGDTYAITTDAGQFIGGFFTSEPSIGSTTYDGQRIVQNAQYFTAPITGFVVFQTTNGYASPQLELGNSSTAYTPYEGEVYNVSFDTAGTVYKGDLDVLTGVLTVTHKVIDLGDLSWSIAGTSDAGKKRFRGTVDPEGKAVANNQKADIVCEQYETVTANDTYSKIDGVSGSDVDKYIFIYDDTKATMTAADFKTAMSGIKLAYELATPETYNLTPQDIQTVIGKNVVFADTGDISIAYFVDGFTMNDWSLATDYVSDSRLEDAIRDASDIITGTAGGYVVIHDSDNDGQPDEILIMNTASIDTATKVWRWNAGGLGYSTTGYAGTYDTAIDSQGRIVADKITTGNLDASLVTIEHLKATMFEGGKLVLGGANNVEGIFQLKNENDIVIGEMNKDGLKFYGAGPEGSRPYVLLNNSVGFQGCDANGTPIFWVNQDEFSMKKCVAENEISACKKIRFIPVTLKDGNDQVINDGVAVVAIVQI